MRRSVVPAIGAACLVVIQLLAADDAAVIANSGSTNTSGFRIVVERSGGATYTITPRRANDLSEMPSTPTTREIGGELVKRFYADLDAAKPFSDLPRQGCAKSASFGTRLTIELAGEKSPDLSCGDHGNARMKALIEDSNEIMKIFSRK